MGAAGAWGLLGSITDPSSPHPGSVLRPCNSLEEAGQCGLAGVRSLNSPQERRVPGHAQNERGPASLRGSWRKGSHQG